MAHQRMMESENSWLCNEMINEMTNVAAENDSNGND